MITLWTTRRNTLQASCMNLWLPLCAARGGSRMGSRWASGSAWYLRASSGAGFPRGSGFPYAPVGWMANGQDGAACASFL